MFWEAWQRTGYGWLMLAGIIVTLVLWTRLARRDDRLLFVYLGGLTGAFIGAKVVYVLAEGWQHFGAPDMWRQLATGKTVLGALLGGYLTVEIAKKTVRYPGTTGDWFATVTPIGIIFGRIGCLVHGCCLGVPCTPAWYTLPDAAGVTRWPAVPLEILFNAVAIVTFFGWRRWKIWPGQHFHFYLMAYGLFRGWHETMRATPKVLGPFSGYQLAAAAVFLLGLGGFILRRRKTVAVDL